MSRANNSYRRWLAGPLSAHFLVPFWCRKYRRRYTRADFPPSFLLRHFVQRLNDFNSWQAFLIEEVSGRRPLHAFSLRSVGKWTRPGLYRSRYRKLSSSKIKSTQLGFDLEFYGTGERSHCFILIFIFLPIPSNYVYIYILALRTCSWLVRLG